MRFEIVAFIMSLLIIFMLAGIVNDVNAYIITPEEQMLELINEHRINNGVAELKVNNDLNKASKIRVIETSYCFKHERPDNSKFYTVHWKANGENIAKVIISHSYVRDVFNAWKDSKTHNSNMLDKQFKSVGISHYVKNNEVYFCALFSRDIPLTSISGVKVVGKRVSWDRILKGNGVEIFDKNNKLKKAIKNTQVTSTTLNKGVYSIRTYSIVKNVKYVSNRVKFVIK